VTVPTPRFLVSFDIDGTLETGDPPGPLLIEAARRAKLLGHIVGSSSDRTLSEQQAMWGQAGFEYDFVCRKHEMIALVTRFGADKYVHIGDTTHDEDSAFKAGFEFIFTHEAALFGDDPWQRPVS
jgi:hydroxymethylpyrimidine pyrophosphatase-like HAD family hydrolase